MIIAKKTGVHGRVIALGLEARTHDDERILSSLAECLIDGGKLYVASKRGVLTYDSTSEIRLDECDDDE